MSSEEQSKTQNKALSKSYFGMAGLGIGLTAFVLFFVQHNIGDMIDLIFSDKTPQRPNAPITKTLGGLALILGFVSLLKRENRRLAISTLAIGASSLMIELFLIAVVVIILLALSTVFMG